MKIKTVIVLALAFAGLTLCAVAQQPVPLPHIEPAVAPAELPAQAFALPPEVSNAVLAFLLKLAQSNPWLATIISVMGLARVWAKPVVSLIHNFVELSPSKRDDDFVAKVLTFFNSNPIGRVLAYLLDWLTSIKIQVPAKPEPAKPDA